MLIFGVLSIIYPVGTMIISTILLIAYRKKYFSPRDKWLAFPFAMFFGALGYSFSIPAGKVDINNYFEYIEKIENTKLIEIVSNDKDFLYTRDILFSFVSKLHDVHILPFFVGFFIYYIVFYILFDRVARSIQKIMIGDLLKIIIISCCVIPVYSVIGNVRCVFSYAIITLATYRDLVQKKRNLWTLFLYIIPIGLHTSAIIILFLRILHFLVKYFEKWIIFVAFFIPGLINISYEIMRGINGNWIVTILRAATNKAYSYLNWTEGGWATEIKTSLSNKLQRGYGTFFIIAVLGIMYMIDKVTKHHIRILEEPMVDYIYLIAICSLGCLYITTGAFWRFESVVVLFSGIIFVPILESGTKIGKKGINIIFLSSILMLVLNSIWHFRNLIMGETIYNLLSFSGIKIIIQLLRGVFNA